MKKIIFFLLSFAVFAVSTLSAQNEITIRSSCFSDGEQSTVDDLLNHPTLTLCVISNVTDAKLISYKCMAGSAVASNTDFGFSKESMDLIRQLQPGQNFVLKDILVEVTNRKTKIKETVEMPPVTVKIAPASSKACGEPKVAEIEPVKENIVVKMIDYSGKLLTGLNRDTPVKNQKVVLQDKSEMEIQTAVTDNYGDFKFYNLNPNNNYKIYVTAEDDTKIKDNVLYAAKPDGTIIQTFNKTPKGFLYELLPPELHSLETENVEDTELKIKNFGESLQKELLVVENIYYDVNSAEIKPESVEKLDKIISAMKANKSLKLLVTSHTDSRGDDASNMTLSEKRAENVVQYFIGQGVEKFRLDAKGMGETQIMNRCKNGVDCSELEMQLNRRTEFKFTK